MYEEIFEIVKNILATGDTKTVSAVLKKLQLNLLTQTVMTKFLERNNYGLQISSSRL